jgi:hypothetical protein
MLSKTKDTKSISSKSTPEKESATNTLGAVEQMLQGQGFDVEKGVFKNTASLAPDAQSTIVSTILADKKVMFRICINMLNNVICNIEISNDFGLWMTKNGTANIQVPLPVQLYYDIALDDPFSALSLRAMSVGTVIRDYLKNLIADYDNNNRTMCTRTDLSRLLPIIDELEITCVSVDSNGDVDHTGAPKIFCRRLDPHQLLKIHAMNCSIVNISRPSGGQISFQPALVCTFKIDVLHIQMSSTWQTDKVLDRDEIATIRFPGVKAAIAATFSVSTGTATMPMDELMKKFIDVQVLFAATFNPVTVGTFIATAINTAVNPTTIGTQVGAGIESAITNKLIPALQAGIPTLTMNKPKTNGVAAVTTTCGSPSNPVPPLLGPNESVSDFIMELPKTAGKIPCVGTWNEKILPLQIKERYDAA